MATFTGTAGNDVADAGAGTLIGFTGGSVAELQDGTGDIFDALAGDDEIVAGDGDDRIRGGLGADSMDGSDGEDTVAYDDNWGAVFVNLTLGQGFGNAAQGDTYASIEHAVGSMFNDVLIGEAGANRLEGGDGDDSLTGALGADVLVGGNGSDAASYEDNYGAVFINLNIGQGFGNAAQGDTYTSIENVTGSIYDDFFVGNANSNRLDGGDGNDTLIGANGGDTLIGGNGVDTASYEELQILGVNASLVTGGTGGSAQGDTYSGIENLRGSNQADTLTGDGGANRLEGGTGNDILAGGLGADEFVGGNDTDTVTYASSSEAVTIDFDNDVFSGADAIGDIFSSIETIIGTGFNDELVGSMRLEGGAGHDILRGIGSGGRLIGGDGDDLLIRSPGSTLQYVGGNGIDTVSLQSMTGPSGFSLASQNSNGFVFGVENVLGSDFDDSLTGEATGAFANNRLDGAGGNDRILGHRGDDVLIGGDGFDMVSFEDNGLAALNLNLVTGIATRGSETDTLSGIEAAIGTFRDDVMVGDANDNLLGGLSGSDTLTGGAGADIFLFSSSSAPVISGIDTITDFNVADDIMHLENFQFTQFSPGEFPEDAFVIGSAATTASHRIIYNSTTGALFYDADGSGAGAAVQFASLSTALAITHQDFFVV